MITKRTGRNGKVRVSFAMPAAIWADTIHVVGDFNRWDERATPMRQTETGWLVTVELDPGQAYQYRYLLNGSDWHNDWNADRYEPNAFGGDNSVVVTPLFDDEQSELPNENNELERVVNFSGSRVRMVSTG